MSLEEKPRVYLDRGLALLKERGYVELFGNVPHLTGEFNTHYSRAILDVRISAETPIDDIRHAMEKTLRLKGPATQEDVDCMVYAARSVIAEINNDVD